MVYSINRATQLRVPSGFPDIPDRPPGSPAFVAWLREVPENTNMRASAHGILGQQALKDRDNTKEGRARKALHYQHIAKALQGHPLRRRRRPATDMRFAQFLEGRWMSVFSPMQSLYDSLAVEDFSTEKPKDRGRYITECPACGDRPITSGNSKHECSTNGGFISIAKVPNVKKS